jgi:hypothetical protein
MQTLIIEIYSNRKAKGLSSLLSLLDFVKKISFVKKTKSLISALQDDENLKNAIVKKKNRAIAKYL